MKKLRLLTYTIPALLLLIFLSLAKYNARRAPWYERALWNLVEPPSRFLNAFQTSMVRVWNEYISLVDVEKENQDLLKFVQTLQGQLVLQEELKLENQRLKALLNYHEQTSTPSLFAKVISNDPRGEFKSMTIDRGLKDGVDILMPVLGARGLLGRIAKVSSQNAVVLLLDDSNSAVDVLIQRSRERALLVGGSYRPELMRGSSLTRMEYLGNKSDIQEGDVVVTSGFDGVFPEGLPVGTITHLETSSLGIFRKADIVPFENFAEVQEVLVLQRVHVLEEMK
ncbi:MAG: rod shape-determining protein MreC [Deltaproteobacteria bacterium RIFCSPHIGHO2_02_FULL_44_16]|nr:MAG: rod shape-determining protein MreC [Deltaproteobacteria bacterium RIFCSPHIGHO2_02_FULL_44_16]